MADTKDTKAVSGVGQQNTPDTRHNKSTDYSMVPKEPDEVIKLSDREELFLRYYLQNAETRYNGQWSYNYAYDKGLEKLERYIEVETTDSEGKSVKQRVVNPEFERVRSLCAVQASTLLTKPNINARKVQLANERLRNDIVDAELSDIIMQKGDLNPKLKAIQEYNKLNQRIISKVDVRSTSLGIVKHVYEKADKGTVKDI